MFYLSVVENIEFRLFVNALMSQSLYCMVITYNRVLTPKELMLFFEIWLESYGMGLEPIFSCL